MEKIVFIIAVAALYYSCDSADEICDSGMGSLQKVSNTGMIVLHQGLGKFVISNHAKGTIDSFHTFIPCNLPATDSEGRNISEGTVVQFSGNRQKLDIKETPDQLIAGEQYFVLFLDDIAVVLI